MNRMTLCRLTGINRLYENLPLDMIGSVGVGEN